MGYFTLVFSPGYNYNCLSHLPVGGLEHFFFFHSVGNVIIPTDELHHFSGGRYTTNQIYNYGSKYGYKVMIINSWDISLWFFHQELWSFHQFINHWDDLIRWQGYMQRERQLHVAGMVDFVLIFPSTSLGLLARNHEASTKHAPKVEGGIANSLHFFGATNSHELIHWTIWCCSLGHGHNRPVACSKLLHVLLRSDELFTPKFRFQCIQCVQRNHKKPIL